jgi:hypothetical protein
MLPRLGYVHFLPDCFQFIIHKSFHYSIILSPNMSVCRRGFGLDIGNIDHFTTRLGTTSNYSSIANLHTSQITTAHPKSFQACCVFTIRSLVTDSNSGGPSASALNSSLKGGSLPTPPNTFLQTPVQNWHGCPNCFPYYNFSTLLA